MLCLGTSIGVLVVGRLLQGLSAAMVWTVGLALMVDTVGKNKIGQSMGYITIALSLAVPTALILGGVVYDRAGYYAVFAMSFGLLALDILSRVVMVEKKIAKRWLPSSPDEEEERRPAPIPVPERSDPSSQTSRWNRLPPVVSLLKSRRLLTALWCCLVEASVMAALESVLPLFVKRTFGWPSTGAGLIFLAYLAPSILSPIAGYICDRYGARWLMSAGCIIAVPPLVLIRLVTENTMKQKVLLSALLAIMGTGFVLILVPAMAEMTYLVHAKEERRPGVFGEKGAYAQAYGLFNMAFAAGTLIGPLWGGFVEQKAGWGTVGWSLGLFVGVSVVPAVLFTGGWILHPTPHNHPANKKYQNEPRDQEMAAGIEKQEPQQTRADHLDDKASNETMGMSNGMDTKGPLPQLPAELGNTTKSS
ncbi:MAG: hypothetical protein M1823_000869 [Watsoniomyces obsoletus]|nr:MAG: hypothetical protein M1823_000869 [Watsoniomyces obsoletus]